MDINKFKLGVGPMSKDIVNMCLEYSAYHDYPIMIIASRNQVDYDTGYATTTHDLSKLVKESPYYNSDNILLCRDHCGPYFSDLDKPLDLSSAIKRCIKTIDVDSKAGFDLIHIDVSRVDLDKQHQVAIELFTAAIQRNKNILFEFGSEDNTGDTTETLKILVEQQKWIEPWRKNIHYIVAQTGSLVKQKQIGTFNLQQNRMIADQIHNSGYLFKEHNADYLDRYQVALRAKTGVDAINIAPQLGNICSQVLYDLGKDSEEYKKFLGEVLSSGYWVRWVTPEINNDKIKFTASAHYLFGSPKCNNLIAAIGANKYKDALKEHLFKALDEYRIGYQL
jgi:tagatose-1,6-bisphosphate aldolase non-catalytic subunit AgaZ/GatZ